MTRTIELTDPIDESTFHDALSGLLRAAHENGVGLERPWACRHGDDFPDWEVDIVSIAKRPDGEHRAED